MTTQTILVIDDSATIRKMVDSHLSQEGYRVVLAPTAEAGLELVREVNPDLILLDHQLPGTTGLEVCKQIIQFPGCERIPFVVSSTLRKQAYIEYMDISNVVDSLPKPFKSDLLKMTVANALEVGAMVVASQTDGTAVPETVGESVEPGMSGDFGCLGLREVIDFLNNGRKSGMLEIETKHNRVWFFLSEGRIQSVSSSSFDEADIIARMPESLKELAPLLKFTMSSGFSSQVAGIVELLDNKILDPRLLRTLLRHQACVMTQYCFDNAPSNFNFYPKRDAPVMFKRAPLEMSLAALLVEAALTDPRRFESDDSVEWVRGALRGQNLDRSGLSARHVQLLSFMGSTAATVDEIATKSGLPCDQVTRVLNGFRLADWVVSQTRTENRVLIAFEPDPRAANTIKSVLQDTQNSWSGHVVRDEFGLQLLLKRTKADVLLIGVGSYDEPVIPEALRQAGITLPGIVLLTPESDGTSSLPAGLSAFATLARPFSAETLLKTIEHPIQPVAIPVAPAADVAVIEQVDDPEQQEEQPEECHKEKSVVTDSTAMEPQQVTTSTVTESADLVAAATSASKVADTELETTMLSVSELLAELKGTTPPLEAGAK